MTYRNPSAQDFKDLIYGAIFNAPGGHIHMPNDVYNALEHYLRAPSPTPAAEAPEATRELPQGSTEAEQMVWLIPAEPLMWLHRLTMTTHVPLHALLHAEILRRMRGGV